jgi:hypothetical protein
MQRSQSHALVHGAVGGLAAALVVALWFLGVDLIAGQPFQTPARLADAIIGGEHVPGARLVAVYTVLHFAVFAALGMAAASFLRAVGVAPGLLVGVVFGLVVLTGVHYGALLLTGGRVLDVLPPLHVVAANLLGGMAMMAYLHLATREAAPLGLGVLREHPMVARGLVTGFIGAVAVAVWFFILDVARGQPFFTPAAPPAVLRAGVLAFALLEGLFIGIVASLSEWVLGALGYWAVAVGNLLAIASMVLWVLRTHPTLRHSFGAMRQEPQTVTTGSGERR